MANTLRTQFLDANVTASNFGITLTPTEMKSVVSEGGTLYVSFSAKGKYKNIQVGLHNGTSFLDGSVILTDVTDYHGTHSVTVGTEDLVFKLTPAEENTKLDLDTLVSAVPFVSGVTFDVPDYDVKFGDTHTYTTTVTGLPLGRAVETTFPKGLKVDVNDKTVANGSAETVAQLNENDKVVFTFGIREPSLPDIEFNVVAGDTTSTWNVRGRDRIKYAEERKLFGDHENTYRKFRFWDNPIAFDEYDLNHTVALFKDPNKRDANLPCLNMVITKSQKETLRTSFPMRWIGTEETTLRVDSQGYLAGTSTSANAILLRLDGGVSSAQINVKPNDVFYVEFGYPEYPQMIDFQNDPYSFLISKYETSGILSYGSGSEFEAFLVITSNRNTSGLLTGSVDCTEVLAGDLKTFVIDTGERRFEIDSSSFKKETPTRLIDIDLGAGTTYVGNAIYQNGKLYIPVYKSLRLEVLRYDLDTSFYVGDNEIKSVYVTHNLELFVHFKTGVYKYSLIGAIESANQDFATSEAVVAEVTPDSHEASLSLARCVPNYAATRPLGRNLEYRLDIYSDDYSTFSDELLSRISVRAYVDNKDGSAVAVELSAPKISTSMADGRSSLIFTVASVTLPSLTHESSLRISVEGVPAEISTTSKMFAQIRVRRGLNHLLCTIPDITGVNHADTNFTLLFDSIIADSRTGNDFLSLVKATKLDARMTSGWTSGKELHYVYSDGTTSPYTDPVIEDKVDLSLKLRTTWEATTTDTLEIYVDTRQKSLEIETTPLLSKFDAHYDNGYGKYVVDKMVVLPVFSSVGAFQFHQVTVMTSEGINLYHTYVYSGINRFSSFGHKLNRFARTSVSMYLTTDVPWLGLGQERISFPLPIDDQRIKFVMISVDSYGAPLVNEANYYCIVNDTSGGAKYHYGLVKAEEFTSVDPIKDKSKLRPVYDYGKYSTTTSGIQALTFACSFETGLVDHFISADGSLVSLDYVSLDTSKHYRAYPDVTSYYRRGSTTYGITENTRTRTPRLISQQEVQPLSENFAINRVASNVPYYVPKALTEKMYTEPKYVFGQKVPYSFAKTWMESGGVTLNEVEYASTDVVPSVKDGIHANAPALVEGSKTVSMITSVKYGYASHSTVRHFQSTKLEHTLPDVIGYYEPSSNTTLDAGVIRFGDVVSLPITHITLSCPKFKFVSGGSTTAFEAWSRTSAAHNHFNFDNEGYAEPQTADAQILKDALQSFGDTTLVLKYPAVDSSITLSTFGDAGKLQEIRSVITQQERSAAYFDNDNNVIDQSLSDVSLLQVLPPEVYDLRVQYPKDDAGFPLGYKYPIFSSDYALRNTEVPDPYIKDYSTDLVNKREEIKTYFIYAADYTTSCLLRWEFENCPADKLVTGDGSSYAKLDAYDTTTDQVVTELVTGQTYKITNIFGNKTQSLAYKYSFEMFTNFKVFAHINVKYATPLDSRHGYHFRTHSNKLDAKPYSSFYELPNTESKSAKINSSYVPKLCVATHSYNDTSNPDLDPLADYYHVQYYRPTDLKNIAPVALAESTGMSYVGLFVDSPVIQDPIRRKTFIGATAYTSKSGSETVYDNFVYSEDWAELDPIVNGNILAVTPLVYYRDGRGFLIGDDKFQKVVVTDEGIHYLSSTEFFIYSEKQFVRAAQARENSGNSYNYRFTFGAKLVPRPEPYVVKCVITSGYNNLTGAFDPNGCSFVYYDKNEIPATHNVLASDTSAFSYDAGTRTVNITVPPFAVQVGVSMICRNRSEYFTYKFILPEEVDTTGWNNFFMPYASGMEKPTSAHTRALYNKETQIITVRTPSSYFELSADGRLNDGIKREFDVGIVERAKGKTDYTTPTYNASTDFYDSAFEYCLSHDQLAPYLKYVYKGIGTAPKDLICAGSSTFWFLREGRKYSGCPSLEISYIKDYRGGTQSEVTQVLRNTVFINSERNYNSDDSLYFDSGNLAGVENLRSLHIVHTGKYYRNHNSSKLSINRLELAYELPIDTGFTVTDDGYRSPSYVFCSLYPELNSGNWEKSSTRIPKLYQDFYSPELVGTELEDKKSFEFQMKRLPNYDYYTPHMSNLGWYGNFVGTKVCSCTAISSSHGLHYKYLYLSSIQLEDGTAISTQSPNMLINFNMNSVVNTSTDEPVYNGNEGNPTKFIINTKSEENARALTRRFYAYVVPKDPIEGHAIQIPLELGFINRKPAFSFRDVGNSYPNVWVESNVVSLGDVSDGVVIVSKFPKGTKLKVNGNLYVGDNTDAHGIFINDSTVNLTNRDSLSVVVQSYSVFGGSVVAEFDFNGSIKRFRVTNKTLNGIYFGDDPNLVPLYKWVQTFIEKHLANKKLIGGVSSIYNLVTALRGSTNSQPNKLASSARADLNAKVDLLVPKPSSDHFVGSMVSTPKTTALASVTNISVSPKKVCAAALTPKGVIQKPKDLEPVRNSIQYKLTSRMAPVHSENSVLGSGALTATFAEYDFNSFYNMDWIYSESGSDITNWPRGILSYFEKPLVNVRLPMEFVSFHADSDRDFPRYLASVYPNKSIPLRDVRDWSTSGYTIWLADAMSLELVPTHYPHDSYAFNPSLLTKSDHSFVIFDPSYTWTGSHKFNEFYGYTTIKVSHIFGSFLNDYVHFKKPFYEFEAKKFVHYLNYYQTYLAEYYYFRRNYYIIDPFVYVYNERDLKSIPKLVSFRFEQPPLLCNAVKAKARETEYVLANASTSVRSEVAYTLPPRILKLTKLETYFVDSPLNVMGSVPSSSVDIATEERIPGYFATESEARLDAEDKGYVDTGNEAYILVVYEYLPNHWAWSVRFERVGFRPNTIVNGYVRGG